MPRKPSRRSPSRGQVTPPDDTAAAVEVAAFLVALLHDADWAEEMMEFVLKRCPAPDPDFWRAVREALAQIRG